MGGVVLLKSIVENMWEHAAGGLLATADAPIPGTVARSLVSVALQLNIVEITLEHAALDSLATVNALIPGNVARSLDFAALHLTIVEITREHAALDSLVTANALIQRNVARSLVFAALHRCIVHGLRSLQDYAGTGRLGTASVFIPGSVAPGGVIVEQVRSIVKAGLVGQAGHQIHHILISQILNLRTQ
jgi:hypothetical protein